MNAKEDSKNLNVKETTTKIQLCTIDLIKRDSFVYTPKS